MSPVVAAWLWLLTWPLEAFVVAWHAVWPRERSVFA